MPKMMNPRRIDYGVYLVTDTTPAVLGQGDLAQIVEASLRGGATCVQHRDKHGPLDAVLATARRLHAITRSFGVPLIINDWVEVAAEIGCEGVHLGRDDMGERRRRAYLASSPSRYGLVRSLWNGEFSWDCHYSILRQADED